MGRHARHGPSRREFLVGGAGLGVGVGLLLAGRTDFLFGGDAEVTAAEAALAAPAAVRTGGPVPVAESRPVGAAGLVADPAGRLALPDGFRYSVVAEAGVTKLEGGSPTPGRADGMGAFAGPGGTTVLVTNHEIGRRVKLLPVPAAPLLTYDPVCGGGTTTVVLGPGGRRRAEYVSLAGTEKNCAGGVTPWGTWLTCEETEARAGDDGRKRDHGYVFEVDPLDRSANLRPEPVKALGRFPHEAAVVDPASGAVYLTEDAVGPNGLLYRWTPPAGFVPGKGALKRLGPDDGVLSALRAWDSAGRIAADLSVADEPGTTYKVRWVPVADRDARKTPTRRQFAFARRGPLAAKDVEVTRARKLEGAWWADDGLYFVSSYARPRRDGSARAHGGQVWFLEPAAGTLRLVLWYAPRADGRGLADGPDNITVSPYGGVIIAEDGLGGQHLLGATPMGRTLHIARNDLRLPGGGFSEFTGPTFSPDRRTLYANLQVPGTTFAITGPWEQFEARLR